MGSAAARSTPPLATDGAVDHQDGLSLLHQLKRLVTPAL